MSIRFLLDENLRGPLWQAILRHNLNGEPTLDAVRIGDFPDLPLGSDDPDILAWAEREGRLLITEDRHTMPAHLERHLAADRHSPGVLMVRREARIRDLLETLVLIACVGEPSNFADAVIYIP